MCERNPGYILQVDLTKICLNEPAINRKVERAKRKARTLQGDNKIAWLLKCINFIDLTTLSGNDTATNVEMLCKKATKPFERNLTNVPSNPAAICVYPARVRDAVEALQKYDSKRNIRVASVAAGFPTGQYPLESRLQEIRYAVEEGANEIDIVINRQLALAHNWEAIYDELKAMRKACGDAHMKAILATGELFDLTDVYVVSMIAMMAGSDFIKTSTGKESVNATLSVGVVMCRAIRDYELLTGYKVGLKPAGGIRTATEALEWMTLIKEELGNSWLNDRLFRIGASGLLDDIVNTIIKLHKT